MNLVALPAFTDNYVWMLHDGREALVVDPGDAAPVLAALSAAHLTLTGILVTHHHADHVGGLPELLPRLKGPVWGPAREALPVPVTPVHGGDRLHWGPQAIEVLDVPGHTAGHVAYHLPARHGEAPLLFCGDTLFSAGCGRLFEGTPEQMARSLRQIVALPPETRLCCAHEYTVSNLRFALAVEPGRDLLNQHLQRCLAQRERGEPTLPSTLALEREINPFLRCDVPAVMAAARLREPGAADAVAVLAALREWKNGFR